MKGDFTRSTFRPEKHYSGVRMQQGRVQLDADWNEQIDIGAHRTETEAVDVIGGCGAPMHKAGFALTDGAIPAPKITIGRYYVDGILCENGAEIAINQQPDLPNDPTLKTQLGTDGLYLVYLDVWQRHITALEDDGIREVALGGPDTATRTKTLWQVKLLGPLPGPLTCASEPADWKKLLDDSKNGTLSAQAKPSASDKGPCVVPPGAGYRRLENQLYRVEVHEVDAAGNLKLLKWSRDNGSIVTRWLDQKLSKPSELIVSSIGRDSVLSFGPGQYVEITDDARELRGQAGILVKLANAEGEVLTLDTTDPNAATVSKADFPDKINNQPNNPKVRRWDGVEGPPADWFELEDGVQIKFGPGEYHVGDYWLIPARTATGDVEWPRDDADPPNPILQPRAGIEHHYCKLGILQRAGPSYKFTDCRELFPPLTELTTLLYESGDGQEAMPGNALPQKLRARVVNGQAPVSGAQVQFSVKAGGGSLANTPLDTTAADGIAECVWTLGTAGPQQVQAVLLDAAGQSVPGQVLHFNANLSIASQVAYDPALCTNLAGTATVQEAIDKLCALTGSQPEDKGIRVKDVLSLADGGSIENDSVLPVQRLATGLRVVCDGAVFPDSVNNRVDKFQNAVCFVTLNLPFPSRSLAQDWRVDASPFVGFQPIVLSAEVGLADDNVIQWKPSDFTTKWLLEQLFGAIAVNTREQIETVLARLTLKGNFIWAKETDPERPDVYLDGDTFGMFTNGHTAVRLSSGNGRRGGDFEMWFWLKKPG